jgi:hypothetical protein
MRQIADDVWYVPLAPRDGVNAYILGDVLVDAIVTGSRSPARRRPLLFKISRSSARS